ncbi:hypothetical protein DESUT3_24560 [Desulfuromonas versatilis]|uniref:Type II secretion system protein GspE N-terminal domain-containing protein n=2 Tax=Desulfuromonas versatilis TaxID=2802975 RepID=A0ABM8HX68_9BACT|nr:hypothetical protein DESUT3_24560 [Desulfuromonas versatilis]
MLIDAGIIDEFQLDSALSYQRHWGGRLGGSLIRLGYVTEEKLLDFLAEQLELPQIDPARRKIPADVLGYVPMEKAVEYNIIPIGRKEMYGTVYLLVAMSDPTNLNVLDALQFATGCRVKPAIASRKSILEAIERHYGPLPADEDLVSAPPSVRENKAELFDLEESPELLLSGSSGADQPPASLEQRLQQLLILLRDRGVLSLQDYERLK